MTRTAIALAFGALLSPALAPVALAQTAPPAITEAEAHAIGVDAYIYLYSLLSMDVTRRQFTNVPAGKEFGKGPMNTFVSVPEYPPADFKAVVRSNFDTLYSSAWLDLDRKSTRLNSSHLGISYAVFCLKKKKN